jgi:myo-inositol catabolism protein IolC
MIEVIAPPGMRYAEGELAAAVDWALRAGLDPDWWKLPNLPEGGEAEWRRLAALLDRAGSRARLVPLGGDRPIPELVAAFGAVRRTDRGGGFAIGRSVFGPSWRKFLAGDRSEALADDVARRTLELVAAWREAAAEAVRT